MYLRRGNENEDAKARQSALDKRIDALRKILGPTPSPDDAQLRLELAGILNWRGSYRATQELLEPLLNPEFPIATALEARQLIGDNHFRHDQYDIANRTYHENLTAAQSAGDEGWAARASDGVAWVLIDVGHYTTGEFEDAERIFQWNLSIHRKQGKWISEAMSVYGLSRASAGVGDYDLAIEYALSSIDLLEKNGGEHLLQLPILQLANIYRDHGNFDKARPYFESAVDAADRSQDTYLQALVAYHFGTLLKWVGELDAARDLWSCVLPHIAEWDYPRLGSEISRILAELAANGGAYEDAYRLQIDSEGYGNRVGVISQVLQNQQMLLRNALHQTQQLEDRLTFLTAGVEASEDGIFVLGPPTSERIRDVFVLHFANAAAAEMLGKKPVEVMHVLIGTYWKTPSAKQVIEASREVYATGIRCSLDPVELEFIEGNPRWYAVKIARITDGIAWTVSDVTERETMRQEILAQRDRLEEANARLVALDKEKSEVLGIAAHDLRSPISNIRSICDFIPVDDPRTAKFTSLIETTSDSLLVLIANLLDVERIDRGDFQFDIQRMSIVPVIREIVDQFSAAGKEKQIEIVFANPDELLWAWADDNAFRRVLQNLFSNAIKFSPLGATVEVRASNSHENVRVEVQDQGPGISATDRKSLFGKFARLSAQPTAGESSSGLGLSIVKHLLEAMNGRVGCESESGHGAIFFFELPADAASFSGDEHKSSGHPSRI